MAFHFVCHHVVARSRLGLWKNGCRWYSASTGHTVLDLPLSVGIVGSGPAGFYTAQYLKKRLPHSRIDIYEALPVPYGLIRYGVAPDHPEIKNVTKRFNTLLESKNVRFLGNLPVASTPTDPLTIESLSPHYHGLIFATGADGERKLHVEGENAVPNIFSARSFVGWYNGLPEFRNLKPCLKGKKAVIVGMGNVAIDVARILLKAQDDQELPNTDIAAHAMKQLLESNIEEVEIIGRRGPLEASFTAKELKELFSLPYINILIEPQDIDRLTPKEEIWTRYQTRIIDILMKGTKAPPNPKFKKTLKLRFVTSPVCFNSVQDENVVNIVCNENRLEKVNNKTIAVATGKTFDIKASLVLESLGYEVKAPYGFHVGPDGNVPNEKGKVYTSDGNNYFPGLYVSGWLKSGPKGVIASTRIDALETANSLLDDIKNDRPMLGNNSANQVLDAFDGVKHLITGKRVWVENDDWFKIEEIEKTRGLGKKPFEKIVSIEEMMNIINKK